MIVAVTNQKRMLWDEEAETFDEAPDHGLSQPEVQEAWRRLLMPLFLSDQPQHIADLGCGTGTLSLLLAEAGHQLTGVDFAPRMLEAARDKTATVHPAPVFIEGDAAQPPFAAGSFDAVRSRHVLWAMPNPLISLQCWRNLLRPGGLIVLVEGRWSTGAGLTATECERLLQRLGGHHQIEMLNDPTLWGGPIDDERYLATWSLSSERDR